MQLRSCASQSDQLHSSFESIRESQARACDSELHQNGWHATMIEIILPLSPPLGFGSANLPFLQS